MTECPRCGPECVHCGQCGAQCSYYALPGLTMLCSDACVSSWKAQEALLGHRWDVRPPKVHGFFTQWAILDSARTYGVRYVAHVDPIELLVYSNPPIGKLPTRRSSGLYDIQTLS